VLFVDLEGSGSLWEDGESFVRFYVCGVVPVEVEGDLCIIFYFFGGDYRGRLLVSFLLAVSHFQQHPLTLQSPFVSPTTAVTKDRQHSIQATSKQPDSNSVRLQYLSSNNPLIQPLSVLTSTLSKASLLTPDPGTRNPF
jgi:hypothetical protein